MEGIDGKALERVSVLTPVNASHNGAKRRAHAAAAALCVQLSGCFSSLGEAKNAANERACDKRTALCRRHVKCAAAHSARNNHEN